MAEGVQNAVIVVCFMSKKYQDSKNCALEVRSFPLFQRSSLGLLVPDNGFALLLA